MLLLVCLDIPVICLSIPVGFLGNRCQGTAVFLAVVFLADCLHLVGVSIASVRLWAGVYVTVGVCVIRGCVYIRMCGLVRRVCLRRLSSRRI